MKKFLSLLLVLAFLLVIPFGVNADVKYKDLKDEIVASGKTPTKDDTNKTYTYDYTFYIQILEGSLTAGTGVDVIFNYPKDAKSFTCGQVDGFTAAEKSKAEGTTTCTYTPAEDKAVTDKLAIGKFNMVLAENAADCSITYQLGDNTGKINPPTGSSISYIIVGAGVLAAAAAFVVSKKKSKLYNL